MFADLFVNISIVIALVFLYMQVRWKSQGNPAKPMVSNLIDGLSGGLMGYILMYFSIQVTEETILDLRYVPVMLLLLFIGKMPATISSGMIIFARFFIGVNRSAYYAIFMMLALLIGYLILNKLLKNEDRMIRKGLYFTLYSNVVTTYFLIFLVADFSTILPIIPVFWFISTLGGVSAVYLVNYICTSEYLFSKYQIESSTDFLTGLSNVRRFEEYWEKVSAYSKANQEPCSIIMIDIDRFKLTNDTYGHAAGDFVLVELSKILKETIKDKGTVFRKGGEEFVVVLPNCDKKNAVVIAENLRSNVEAYEFITKNLIRIPVTISLGVTVYPETINQIGDMVEMADALLYKSKSKGRNRASV